MKIELDKSNRVNKSKWAMLILVVLTAFWLSYRIINPGMPELNKNELSFVKVQKGTLDIFVPVYGLYKSEHERILSAPSQGLISEILVRVGQSVTPNTVIAKVSNPDLSQEFAHAQSQLKRMESELLSMQFAKQNEELAFQSQLADINSSVELAQLEVNINTDLVSQGITGKIQLEKAKLQLQLHKKREDFAAFRFDKLKEMHKLQLQQQQALVSQQSQVVLALQQKLSSLEIKAGIKGSLQRLSVEVGQRVNLGSVIAKVGSSDKLLLSLNIPQRLAQKVQPKAAVKVRYGEKWLSAQIEQLGSIVENGFIVAEAKLLEPLPLDIRPSQPLNGQVYIETKFDALYVEQKPTLVPLSNSDLFVQNSEQQYIYRTNVSFGELSGKFLVVNSGAQLGDSLIINDMSRWQTYDLLKLNQHTL